MVYGAWTVASNVTFEVLGGNESNELALVLERLDGVATWGKLSGIESK